MEDFEIDSFLHVLSITYDGFAARKVIPVRSEVCGHATPGVISIGIVFNGTA
jgi:hypothetical protein